MPRMYRKSPVSALVVALGLIGCGGSDSASDRTSPSRTTEARQTTDETAEADVPSDPTSQAISESLDAELRKALSVVRREARCGPQGPTQGGDGYLCVAAGGNPDTVLQFLLSYVDASGCWSVADVRAVGRSVDTLALRSLYNCITREEIDAGAGQPEEPPSDDPDTGDTPDGEATTGRCGVLGVEPNGRCTTPEDIDPSDPEDCAPTGPMPIERRAACNPDLGNEDPDLGGDSAVFKRCDANITAQKGTTNCAFASNVFYEYFVSGEASTIRAYSAMAGRFSRLRCEASSDSVVCRTSERGVVKFPQSAVDSYSREQAQRYARSHDVGP